MPYAKTYRGGFGNVDSPDRSIIVGEGQDIPPVSVFYEKRLEQLPVTGAGCFVESRQPLICDCIDVMLQISWWFESVMVRREVGWVWDGCCKNHIAVYDVFRVG